MKYLRQRKADEPLFFSEYGKFVHELLADYYSGRKTDREVYMEYLTQFRKRVPSRAPSGAVFSHYFLDGANFLESIRMPKYKVLAVEQELRFSVGAFDFVAFVDLLCETDDGEFVVVDNKSRNLRRRSGRKKKTKYDIELDEYFRQLYLYSAAVAQNYGKLPKFLCFNCFREGEFIEELFDEEVYRATLKEFVETIEQKIVPEESFDPDVEFFKCTYLCDTKDQCEYFALARG